MFFGDNKMFLYRFLQGRTEFARLPLIMAMTAPTHAVSFRHGQPVP